jgi:iron complex transport system permease protein
MRRPRRAILCLAVLALAALAGAPLLGPTALPASALLAPGSEETGAVILWTLRVPRVLVAFLAGAGLALGGMAFQALFRNPLTTPFTLGIASGAAFGAAVYILIGLPFALAGVPGLPLCAFAGALLAAALVWGLARAARAASPTTMLLAGVAVAFFFSSLILFLEYALAPGQAVRLLRWLMGSLDVAGLEAVLDLAPFVLVGGAVLFCLREEMDLLSFGGELAAARGVDVARARGWIFFAVSLAVGGVVAACGPIGFVGLMVPHVARILVGPAHRALAPASLLLGGTFLVLCDALARTILAPAELPVGVLTALLGGPFFLWLLLRRGERAGGAGTEI